MIKTLNGPLSSSNVAQGRWYFRCHGLCHHTRGQSIQLWTWRCAIWHQPDLKTVRDEDTTWHHNFQGLLLFVFDHPTFSGIISSMAHQNYGTVAPNISQLRMLQKITAAGCLVSSIIAAFVAAKPEGFSNAEAALYAQLGSKFFEVSTK